MKKNQLIIITVILVGFIIGLAIWYPPVDEDESTGTIGKVKKYRNSETEQDEIVLRNEFLQDTTALKTTIDVLGNYEIYLSEMANEFKEWETTIKQTKINNENLSRQFEELNSLALFMKNNLSTVSDTKELLNKYYTKEVVDMSIDVENDLIQFAGFLQNLDQKSKVVDSLFVNLNGILEDEKLELLALTKKETELLIEVREKMLGGIFIFGYTMGNEQRLNMALNSNVLNLFILNKQLNNHLGLIVLINSAEKLAWHNSKKLGVHSNEQLGLFNKENLGLKNADKLNLCFNKEALAALFASNGNEAAIKNIDKLDMFISARGSNEKLQNNDQLGVLELNSQVSLAMKNSQLGALFNQKELGIEAVSGRFIFAKDELGSSAGQFAREGLGNAAWSAQNQLQGFVFSSNILKGFFAGEKLSAF